MLTPKSITKATADSWVGVEYASRCAFSSKWLILQSGLGGYLLHTADGEPAGKLSLISHNQEPGWDSEDHDILYYLTGNTSSRYNVKTHESTLVHVFSEYVAFDGVGRAGVQGLGEGDVENNKVALAGMRPDGRRDVFLYDLKRQKKGNVLTLEPDAAIEPTFSKSGRVHGLDNVYATPGGNVQIGWHQQGKGRFEGVELYDGDMQFIRQLTPAIGHNDVGTYQGRDVLLWCSSADPEINKNGVVAIDALTGEKRILVQFEWAYALHISACARDFCIVSTYAPDNSLPSQIWKVFISGKSPELICDTGSVMIRTPDGIAYNPQPKATVDRQGSRIAYSTNRGITNRDPNYCNVELVILEASKAAPVPKPEPFNPIVVTPQPDLTTELAALRQQLSEAQSWAASRQKFIEQLEDESVRLVGLLARTEEQKRTAEQQVQMLTEVLASMRADTVDPEVWAPIHKPDQPFRRWGLETLPSGLLQMNDVSGDQWTPVEDKAGNTYLLVKSKEPGYEMYARRTNK